MSVEQSKTVDNLSIRDTDGRCVLTIVDHLEWSDRKHLHALQHKLNNYLAFIESGEIYKARPNAHDRKIEISINCQFMPEEPDDIRFLQLVRNAILDAGFHFSVVVNCAELELGEIID